MLKCAALAVLTFQFLAAQEAPPAKSLKSLELKEIPVCARGKQQYAFPEEWRAKGGFTSFAATAERVDELAKLHRANDADGLAKAAPFKPSDSLEYFVLFGWLTSQLDPLLTTTVEAALDEKQSALKITITYPPPQPSRGEAGIFRKFAAVRFELGKLKAGTYGVKIFELRPAMDGKVPPENKPTLETAFTVKE